MFIVGDLVDTMFLVDDLVDTVFAVDDLVDSVFYFNRVAPMIATFNVLMGVSLTHHEFCTAFSYKNIGLINMSES